MKTLMFCTRVPDPAPLDATYVLWEEPRGDDGGAASAWIDGWMRHPLRDGLCFQDLAVVDGLSVADSAARFLLTATHVPRHVRAIAWLDRTIADHGAGEVRVLGLPAAVERLLARVCRARAVLFHGRERRSERRLGWRLAALSGRSRLSTATALARALARPRCRPPAVPSEARGLLLMLAPSRRDPAKRGADRVAAPDGLSPWPLSADDLDASASAVVRAARAGRRLWVELRHSPGLHESFSHRGVSFADLAAPDFARLLLFHLPWAARVRAGWQAAVDRARPARVCIADPGEAGRIAMSVAREAGISAAEAW